jgi:hypothetical protein
VRFSLTTASDDGRRRWRSDPAAPGRRGGARRDGKMDGKLGKSKAHWMGSLAVAAAALTLLKPEAL